MPFSTQQEFIFAVLRRQFHLLVEVFKSAFVGPHLRFHLKIIFQQYILVDNIQQELVLEVLLVLLRLIALVSLISFFLVRIVFSYV